MAGLLALVMIALLTLTGCRGAQTPPPFEPPAVKISSTHYYGTPLSGPLASPSGGAAANGAADNETPTPTADEALLASGAAPAGTVDAHIQIFSLETNPAQALQSLGASAKLIIAARGSFPVLPAGTLIQYARLNAGDNAAAVSAITSGKWGRWAHLADLHCIVIPGATSAVSIDEPSANLDDSGAGQPARNLKLLLRIQTSESGDVSLSPALSLADFVRPAPLPDIPPPEATRSNNPDNSTRWTQKAAPAAPATAPATPPPFEQELALLPPIIPAGAAQTAMIVPIRFSGGGAAVAIIVSTSPVDAAGNPLAQNAAANTVAPNTAAALKQTAIDLQKSSRAVAAEPTFALAQASNWPALASALDALAVADRRRAALVFLASQTGAALCENVALVIETGGLEQLSDRILAQTHAHPDQRDGADLGWTLESTTLHLLLEMQQANKLPPELAAALTDFAGQAARDASSMAQVMADVTDSRTLQERLVAENVIFLEDSSPAARVRAYDWLRARNLAPDGYDPLGTPRQRRAALDRALSAAQNSPAQDPSVRNLVSPNSGSAPQPAPANAGDHP